jgi:hypothetical protein
VTITISATIVWKEMPPRLCNRHTSWDQFQTYINEKNCLNFRLKDKQELEEAIEYITKLIQEAVTISTPIIKKNNTRITEHTVTNQGIGP